MPSDGLDKFFEFRKLGKARCDIRNTVFGVVNDMCKITTRSEVFGNVVVRWWYGSDDERNMVTSENFRHRTGEVVPRVCLVIVVVNDEYTTEFPRYG